MKLMQMKYFCEFEKKSKITLVISLAIDLAILILSLLSYLDKKE